MISFISVVLTPILILGFIVITPTSTTFDKVDSVQTETNIGQSDIAIPETVKQNSDLRIEPRPELGNTKLFQGSWFDVQYPKDFKASLSDMIEQTKNDAGYVQTDEVSFISPDQSVEFFVYSPMWSGDPLDYLNIKPNEEKISEKIDEKNIDKESKEIYKYVTLKAVDNSYLRSYVSIKGTGTSETHHVFGIKYKDQASYQKYRQDYIDFKNSLVQYLD
jgi:hypothetical protein